MSLFDKNPQSYVFPTFLKDLDAFVPANIFLSPIHISSFPPFIQFPFSRSEQTNEQGDLSEAGGRKEGRKYRVARNIKKPT
jgi:hypothetical protein